MEGCKHPLISCKAPIDVTVMMTAQRSGPKYGLFVVQNMNLLLFIICCLQPCSVGKPSAFNDCQHPSLCFLLDFSLVPFPSSPLLLSWSSPPFLDFSHPLISGIVNASDVFIRQ